MTPIVWYVFTQYNIASAHAGPLTEQNGNIVLILISIVMKLWLQVGAISGLNVYELFQMVSKYVIKAGEFALRKEKEYDLYARKL